MAQYGNVNRVIHFLIFALLIDGKTFNHQQPAIFVNALGNEIYDQYARKIERNTKKVVENKAQADQKALERLAKEEIEARKKAQLEDE